MAALIGYRILVGATRLSAIHIDEACGATQGKRDTKKAVPGSRQVPWPAISKSSLCELVWHSDLPLWVPWVDGAMERDRSGMRRTWSVRRSADRLRWGRAIRLAWYGVSAIPDLEASMYTGRSGPRNSGEREDDAG